MMDNAIDHEQFARTRPSATAKQADHGMPETQFLVGTIGRLSDEKGFDLLIDAFARLVDRGLDARLVIAGEGPEQSSLQNQIDRLGMSQRIQLIGFCEDTRGFLEALDLFVLSSHREGLPNVVLEAMAVGVPVIATRVGGVPRLVTKDKNGRLIDSGSVDQIAEAIEQLAASPDNRERLAAAGAETIAHQWSFRHRIERMADLYREVL